MDEYQHFLYRAKLRQLQSLGLPKADYKRAYNKLYHAHHKVYTRPYVRTAGNPELAKARKRENSKAYYRAHADTLRAKRMEKWRSRTPEQQEHDRILHRECNRRYILKKKKERELLNHPAPSESNNKSN